MQVEAMVCLGSPAKAAFVVCQLPPRLWQDGFWTSWKGLGCCAGFVSSRDEGSPYFSSANSQNKWGMLSRSMWSLKNGGSERGRWVSLTDAGWPGSDGDLHLRETILVNLGSHALWTTRNQPHTHKKMAFIGLRSERRNNPEGDSRSCSWGLKRKKDS